jgi:hypothetical protein
MKVLGLEGQPITNTSVPAILKLNRIRELYLQGTNITLGGLTQLAALPKLEYVVITKGLLTPIELSELRQTVRAEIAEDPREWPLPFSNRPQAEAGDPY